MELLYVPLEHLEFRLSGLDRTNRFGVSKIDTKTFLNDHFGGS